MNKFLLSPELFPSVGMMALCKSATEVWLEYHDHFPKQTLRNRFYILTAQGVLPCTVPVVKHSKMPSHQVGLDYGTWQPRQVLDTLQTAYGKAPFWNLHQDWLKDWLFEHHIGLSAMQQAALTYCLDSLGLDLTIRQTESYKQVPIDCFDATDLITKQNFAAFPDLPAYPQCFGGQSFSPNLCLLDLLLCMGPDASYYVPEYLVQVNN